MSGWLTFSSGRNTLEAWSSPHQAAVTVILLFCIGFLFLKNLLHSEESKKTFRYVFAAFIALQQTALYVWYTVAGEWSLELALPIQLCDLSVFLSIAMLISKRQIPMELLYFWGVGGATQAILTPDIGSYTWPHFVFYQFFISHGVILLTCIYMISVEKFRPARLSVPRAFIITNLYGLLIMLVNRLTGGNYLFLTRKPAGGSLLDFLGPWPWYLLSLDAVALVLFALLYLPFAFGGKGTGAGIWSGSGKSGISA